MAPRLMPSRLVDLVQRRRDELCFALWGLGMLLAARGPDGAEIADLVRLVPAGRSLLAWGLVAAGVGVRVWAAGNLEKNRFARPAGPYRLVRHPLYAGTLLISLGFFAALGRLAGLALWGLMLAGVFLPVIRKEERELRARYPGAYGAYLKRVPRLLPDLAAIRLAVSSDRFSASAARRNFGARALWFFALVPALAALARAWRGA